MMSMSGAPKRRSSWFGEGRSRGEIVMASLNRDGGTSCVLYIPMSGCRERYREGSMANRVVHFEIIHPEAAQIQKFFADVFDWAINTANPMNYGMVDTGAKDYGIQGGIAAPGPFGDGHITFYVEVDDVDAALAKAVAAGGTIALPKINIGGAPGAQGREKGEGKTEGQGESQAEGEGKAENKSEGEEAAALKPPRSPIDLAQMAAGAAGLFLALARGEQEQDAEHARRNEGGRGEDRGRDRVPHDGKILGRPLLHRLIAIGREAQP